MVKLAIAIGQFFLKLQKRIALRLFDINNCVFELEFITK